MKFKVAITEMYPRILWQVVAHFGDDSPTRWSCGFLHFVGKVACLQPAEFSAVTWETEVAHFPETSEQTYYLSLCKNLEEN